MKKRDDHFEANLLALFDSTENFIWTVDLNYCRVFCNRAFRENINTIYGFSNEVGITKDENLPPEIAAFWKQLYDQALTKGPFRIEYPLADGRTFEMFLNLIIVQGKVTGVSVFGKDITEHKKSAQARVKSDTHFNMRFEENASVMLIVDPSTGLISAANQSASKYYGYAPQQMIGMPINKINISAPDEILRQGEQVIRNERNFFQCRHRLASGELRDVEIFLSHADVDGSSMIFSVVHDVTDRRLTTLALAESESRFNRLFEKNDSVMLLIEPISGAIIAANHAAARFYAYSIEQLIKMNISQINTMQHHEILTETHRALECDRNYFEFRHRLASGEEREVEVYSTPIDVDNRPVLFSVIHDVTARKQTEIALRESRDSLRLAQAIGGLGSYALNISTMVWSSSQIMDQIFGIDESYPHTLQGWSDLIHPDERESTTAYFTNEVLGKRMPFDRQYRILRRNDNAERWVHGMGQLEFNDLDQPSVMHGIIKDITDSKLAEIQLRESEAHYRTIFQTTADGISISRLSDGKYIDINNAFLDLIGYSREEMIGRTSLELNIWVHPEFRNELVLKLRQHGRFQDLATQFYKKNGELIWVLISASLIMIQDIQCILSISRNISDVKAAEEKIRELAFYDQLTHLPNRRLLLDRISQAQAACERNNRNGAVLFIDLDHFKTLNDSLGHQMGDLLLQEVARRLTSQVRETDTVARYGGDEFIVIFNDLSIVSEEAASQAQAIAEKVLAAVRKPYDLDGHILTCTASIGITIFGEKREDADLLLRQADIAMYHAKSAGRNSIRFFVPALQAAVNARASLEAALHLAVKEKQFMLFYQPLLLNARIVGVEALVLWMHPTMGLLAPAEFIPLAEETGIIAPLGKWVLESACSQLAAWALNPLTQHLSMAINISVKEFHETDFVLRILDVISKTGANPANIQLELTESIFIENVEDVISKMNTLKSYGLKFALDDFGTGYSSLAYLKRLPLDILKIDRSFVRDILTDANSRAIVQTIISLGMTMNMAIIAEGVEFDEQRVLLASLGCHFYQGYLYGRPLPVEELEQLVLNHPHRV